MNQVALQSRAEIAPAALRAGSGIRRVPLEPALAAITLFALGMRQILHTELSTGYVLALLFVPLWFGSLRRYGGARAFLGLGVVSVFWGVFMPKISGSMRLISSINRNNSVVLLLGTLAGIGVVLWARNQLSVSGIGLWYGAGMLAGGVAGYTAAGGNPWKFVWAVPVAITLLALVMRSHRRLLQLAALALLMVVSAGNDSRSYLASFLLVAALLIWQWRPTQISQRASWMLNAGMLGGIAYGVYYLGTTLLVSGYLGQAAQQRSIEQIDQSGSLILGGRPELAATWALIKHHPWGYGAGVLPSPQDVLVAKTGMFNIGYLPNNGYVDKFMFGGGIELHSMFGDLWATYGIPGLVFTAAIAFVTVRGMAYSIARRQANAMFLFLCVWTLWNVAFSPFYAAQQSLILTIGLALLPAGSGRLRNRGTNPGHARQPGQLEQVR